MSSLSVQQLEVSDTDMFRTFSMFGDAMLVSAGHIKNTQWPVVATLASRLLTGDVTVGYTNGSTVTLERGSHNLTNVAWVYHGQTGYVLPSGVDVSLLNDQLAANWSTIGVGKANTKADMFTLTYTLARGAQASDYVLLPDVQEADVAQLAADYAGFSSRYASDGSFQVERGASLGFSFVSSGQQLSGSWLNVSSDQPAIVLVTREASGSSVSVAVSSPVAAAVTLTTSPALSCSGDDGVDVSKDVTSGISFALPTGNQQGETVTRTCTLN